MLRLSWEKRGPLLVGVAAACAAYWYGERFFHAAATNKWHLDQLYVSVFNVAAPASAFLFAFYTYVRTAEGAILREIRGAPIFRRASRYMIWAIVMSASLAIATVPLVVVVPEPHSPTDKWYFVVVLWTGISAYVLAAIVRSVYHFIAIMEAAFGDRLQG